MDEAMSQAGDRPLWVHSAVAWLLLAVSCVLLYVMYSYGISRLLDSWMHKEEYSHGLIIPFLSLFLIWQKKDILQKIPTSRSWGGVVLTVLALLLWVVGEVSDITVISQFSFIVALMGVTLSMVGWQMFRQIWVAFLFLLVTIPLPREIYQEISQFSQLLSSRIGVAVIRLFDISVYLEGNVIDLGVMKLQVVDACSGLRYLFPLMSLSLICAYFYQDVLWKRVVIFLSSIPVAILMNSLRIGLIGVTVEYWGKGAAEGVLHDFEGWVVFMSCTAVLVLVMWLLSKIGRNRKPLMKLFFIEMPAAGDTSGAKSRRPVTLQFVLVVLLVAGGAVGSGFVKSRVMFEPERKQFVYFPTTLGQWQGKVEVMDSIYVDRLSFDDYFLTDYVSPAGKYVNVYMAYYGEQRKEVSIHSPRLCLPGDGWKMDVFEPYTVPGVSTSYGMLQVNRVLIRKGESTQLVYYWFKQGARDVTSEFYAKWWIFWDALTRNRTDGALIRLTTPVDISEDIADADARLAELTKNIYPKLPEYIPD